MAEITKLEFRCDCGHEGAPRSADIYSNEEPTGCGCCRGPETLTLVLTCTSCGLETSFKEYSLPTVPWETTR